MFHQNIMGQCNKFVTQQIMWRADFFPKYEIQTALSLTLDYPVFSLILPSILWTEHWWWFGFFSSGGREFSASSLCTHSGFLLPKHACAVCAFPPCRTTVKNLKELLIIARETIIIKHLYIDWLILMVLIKSNQSIKFLNLKEISKTCL